ncbi:hypothetical protein ABRP93_10710, partial [Corynebacterium sp. KPL2850]
MTSLFTPLELGRYTLNNRVTMAPLTRQRAGHSGVPSELHKKYYSQRASAGLVVTEGTFPAWTNRAFPGQAGIVDDEQAAGWREVANEVHEGPNPGKWTRGFNQDAIVSVADPAA